MCNTLLKRYKYIYLKDDNKQYPLDLNEIAVLGTIKSTNIISFLSTNIKREDVAAGVNSSMDKNQIIK